MAATWKQYSKLLNKKYRQQERKFLTEGVRLCHEALLSDWEIETAFITREFSESSNWFQIQELLKQKKAPYRVLESSQFKRLTDTDSPQGIVLVVRMPGRSVTQINLRKAAFIVLLQGVHDPGNMGTIIRTADWYGVNAVLLSEDCVDPFNPKVLRSTMGSIFHIPVMYIPDLAHTINELKQHHFRVVATSITRGKIVHHTQFRKPIALILGGEAMGVSPDTVNRADVTVRIWKYGQADSLNVAVAGAILMDRIATNIFQK